MTYEGTRERRTQETGLQEGPVRDESTWSRKFHVEFYNKDDTSERFRESILVREGSFGQRRGDCESVYQVRSFE